MDTFAALALATDPPTDKILDRPPQPKSAPLITINMWKMIIGQAIFQLIVTFILYFAGSQILGYDDVTDPEMRKTLKTELDTMVFNTFVWMQIFNEFNNRRLDNKFNIFEGIQRNNFFMGITLLMVGLQVAIIFVGGPAFQIKPINGTQWAICVVAAVLCLPWAVLVRLFPDAWFEIIAKTVGAPVVVVYRFLAKGVHKFGRLFKKNKKSEDSSSQDVEANPEKGSGSGLAHAPTTPEIVLSGETDAVHGHANPTIQVEDLEKGERTTTT